LVEGMRDWNMGDFCGFTFVVFMDIYQNSWSKVYDSWCRQNFCGRVVEKSLFAHHHSDHAHCIHPDICGKKVSMLLLQSYEFIWWKHWKRNKESSWVERKARSLMMSKRGDRAREDTSMKQPTLWLMMLHSPFVCVYYRTSWEDIKVLSFIIVTACLSLFLHRSHCSKRLDVSLAQHHHYTILMTV
jgi:hypothetical protein